LRNRKLRQTGIQTRQVWRLKDKPEGSNRSAPACLHPTTLVIRTSRRREAEGLA
jgi:hypothetical protein